MKWVIVGELTFGGGKLYGRIDDDGLMRVTAVEAHPELQAWLAEGNTPEDISTNETE
jgi:hypothetical protein